MVFAWVSFVILVILSILVPKRLSFKENVVIFCTVGYLAVSSHILVGSIIDSYDLGPTKDVDFIDWVIASFVPSMIAVLYLNLKRTDRSLLYVSIWTILSLLFEYFFVRSGYMTYSGWTLWCSIPIYFMAFLVLPWYLKFVRKKE